MWERGLLAAVYVVMVLILILIASLLILVYYQVVNLQAPQVRHFDRATVQALNKIPYQISRLNW